MNISDEDYRQMKARATSRELHERIVNARKRPRRIVVAARYAAILMLPLVIAVYFLLDKEKQSPAVVVAQVEKTLPAPERKQPRLILDDGKVVNLGREVKEEQITLHAVNRGNELAYEKNQVVEEVETLVYNTVEVPKGGEYHVSLADGTRVWFNEETRLRFPVTFAGATRDIYLERGEIYLEVEKDDRHPFIVHTGNGDIRVLGTHFNVKASSGRVIETTLVEGRVCLTHGGESVLMLPGVQAEVLPGSGGIRTREVNVKEFVLWKDGIFYFEGADLATIMERLARWYDVNVNFDDEELGKLRFSVEMKRYEHIQDLLTKIEKTRKVRFRIEGREIRVGEYREPGS